VLGLQPVLRTVFRCLRSEPASPFWGEAGRKNKILFSATFFLGKFSGGEAKFAHFSLMSKERVFYILLDSFSHLNYHYNC